MNSINCTEADADYSDWEAFKRNSEFYSSLCTNDSRSGELSMVSFIIRLLYNDIY